MISTKQNEERHLRQLAAQRNLYSRAKAFLGWQVFLTGPVAVVSALAVLAEPNIKSGAALVGLAIVLLDLFWLAGKQKILRNEGALIQEEFDCEVLGLSWNQIKAGHKLDPETIKQEADRYESRFQSFMPTLKDWYSPTVDKLPEYLARILCQRSNCWWDANQRRSYASVVVTPIVVISIGLFAVGFMNRWTLEELLLRVILPLLPLFVLGIRQFTEHREAAARLEKLKQHCESLWTSALAGRAEAEVAADSRKLQDEIFENRKKSPLVFDFVFKRIRASQEDKMQFGVEDLVNQALAKAKQ